MCVLDNRYSLLLMLHHSWCIYLVNVGEVALVLQCTLSWWCWPLCASRCGSSYLVCYVRSMRDYRPTITGGANVVVFTS